MICFESMVVAKASDSLLPKSFSIFKTGSALISHIGMFLTATDVGPTLLLFGLGMLDEVTSHLMGVWVVESAATFCGEDEPMPASSGSSSLMSRPSLPNCFNRFSANVVAMSFCDKSACSS